MIVWPVKVTVLPEAAIVPAVQVQFRVVRNGPVIVSVPPALLMFRIGRSLVAIAPPVQSCAPPPLISSVPLPPVKPLAAVMSPWAARVPVAMVPLVSVSSPVVVRVVPAAIVTAPPASSTAPSV